MSQLQKTKAAMIVHVLGNCSDIDLITKLEKKNLYLIEDTCESLDQCLKINISERLDLWNFFILLFPSNYIW